MHFPKVYHSVRMCTCKYIHLFVCTCFSCQLVQWVTNAVTQQTVVASLKCRSTGHSQHCLLLKRTFFYHHLGVQTVVAIMLQIDYSQSNLRKRIPCLSSLSMNYPNNLLKILDVIHKLAQFCSSENVFVFQSWTWQTRSEIFIWNMFHFK